MAGLLARRASAYLDAPERRRIIPWPGLARFTSSFPPERAQQLRARDWGEIGGGFALTKGGTLGLSC